MSAIVTVVCDNPRHVGKVAKLLTFKVSDDGEVTQSSILRRARGERDGRRLGKAVANAFDGPEENRQERVDRVLANYAKPTEPAVCKLCGQRVPVGNGLLHSAIRQFAIVGELCSLRLVDLRSKLRDLEQQ